MVIVISYFPGMSGDFLAYLLHKNKNFYTVPDTIIDNRNRYVFPEFEGLQMKMLNIEWTDAGRNVYTKWGKNKHICLPTHKYEDTIPEFVDLAIKIHTNDEITLRKAYALWWLKSHLHTRNYQRLEMNNDNIPEEHMTIFSDGKSWKMNCYSYGIFPLNLGEYAEKRYVWYSNANKRGCYHGDTYINVNIEDVLDGTLTKIDDFDIDKSTVMQYVDANNKMLNEYGIICDQTHDIFISTLVHSLNEHEDDYDEEPIRFTNWSDIIHDF